MTQEQADLFGAADAGVLPEGVRYVPDAIGPAEEQALTAAAGALDLQPFAFRGFEGNRRTASFGWRYDFNGGGLQEAGPLPAGFGEVRRKAAAIAGVQEGDFVHLLVTEYRTGAGIGWHRDRPQFGVVAGVSLGAPCRMRFRLKAGSAWRRRDLMLEPRSIYVLDGRGRWEWEHSIPPAEGPRYSLTFRTLRG